MAIRKRKTSKRADKEPDGLPARVDVLSPNQAAIRRAIALHFRGKVSAIARVANMSTQGVYQWIKGLQEPQRPQVKAIEKAIRTPLAALWAPDPATVYYRGAAIAPSDEAYRTVERVIRNELKTADPELAKKLGL